MRTTSPRPGVSLLEVVVVLLLAAATCLLLFPVLNRSRENARAKYCRNNLRRLDRAMQEYVEIEREISRPAATMARKPRGIPGQRLAPETPQ